MFNKKLTTTAVAATLIAGMGSTQVQAVEVSGNVALTSDYRFRGISQSDKGMAIQGGFDAAFEQGFYVGTWASSVDFDVSGDAKDTAGDGSIEVDAYVGWSGPIGDTDFGIDTGFIYYTYPGDKGEDGDYREVYLQGSYKDLTLGAAYSDDYWAKTGKFTYLHADYGFGLMEDVTLSLHAGYNILDDDGGFLATGSSGKNRDNYFDYSVSVGYEWADLEFNLAWIGTNLDKKDVFGEDWADDTAVLTISKSL